MAKKKKERPLVSMNAEEREEAWDDGYLKEEGVVLEFDPTLNTGKVKSLTVTAFIKLTAVNCLE